MESGEASESVLERLDELHQRIDREASQLSERHRGRLLCHRGCSGCCLDDLTVSGIEAALIVRNHSDLLENGVPRAVGACALLDAAGACRIYADRPSVCRSQGLPLRIFFEDESGEVAEHRDICPLNLDGGPPLDELGEDECWLIGPVELELLELDRRFSGEDSSRVALRSLFRE